MRGYFFIVTQLLPCMQAAGRQIQRPASAQLPDASAAAIAAPSQASKPSAKPRDQVWTTQPSHPVDWPLASPLWAPIQE